MNINTLISKEELNARIVEIANQINNEYKNEEIVIISILKGAVYFSTELTKNLTSDIKLDFMKVSSYCGTESTGNITFKLDISENIANKNVIIVEDILDTGRTLTYIKDYLSEKNPKQIKICVLLDKKERREFEIEPDYVGFEIPDKFVVGFGLDYDEKYRNLPYIGYIEQ